MVKNLQFRENEKSVLRILKTKICSFGSGGKLPKIWCRAVSDSPDSNFTQRAWSSTSLRNCYGLNRMIIELRDATSAHRSDHMADSTNCPHYFEELHKIHQNFNGIILLVCPMNFVRFFEVTWTAHRIWRIRFDPAYRNDSYSNH